MWLVVCTFVYLYMKVVDKQFAQAEFFKVVGKAQHMISLRSSYSYRCMRILYVCNKWLIGSFDLSKVTMGS